MTEAYDRLSPLFRERLAGLRATHSGIEQSAAAAARGNVVRRPPVVNSHPLVRTHPATGRKALFVNPQCIPTLPAPHTYTDPPPRRQSHATSNTSSSRSRKRC